MMRTTPTSSSMKSNISTDEERSNRDSCYFPGCRKDANCNCDMCQASINATLDLMPLSVNGSSLTKLSETKPSLRRSPVSFNPSIFSTPRMISYHVSVSPDIKSTAKSSQSEKVKEKPKGPWFVGFGFWRFFTVTILIFTADFASPWVVSKLIQPTFSMEAVRNIGKEACVMHDMKERLGFLQKSLGKFVDGEVSNCSSIESVWKLNTDGLLLITRCTLYKLAAEEVSIWGWPLQTSGLLTAGFSSRSFTILSGRVTEWSEGKIGLSMRKANSSWVQRRWSASTVQLDRNTWVLEYQASSILENSRLFSAAIELLKFRVRRTVEEMKQQFWLLPAFAQQYSDHAAQESIMYPT